MDRRFQRVWERMRARRDGGEGFPAVLRSSSNEDLVAALAAAAGDEPVAANAIATELLNRLRGAPYLGAALVSATVAFLLVFLDWAYTGTFLLFESGARAVILIALTLLTTVVSALLWAMGRGRYPGLRLRLRRDRPW